MSSIRFLLTGLSVSSIVFIFIGIRMISMQRSPLARLVKLQTPENTQKIQAVPFNITSVKHKQGIFANSLEKLANQLNAGARIEQTMRLAGLKQMQLGDYLTAISTIITFCIIIALWTRNILIGAILILSAVFLPHLLLKIRGERRLKLIEQQLPEYISHVITILKSGAILKTALIQALDEVPEPLSTELGYAFHNLQFAPIQDSLNELSEQIPSKDIVLLTQAISLQVEGGGDIIFVLENLSAIIRERVKFQKDVLSLTSQQRFSGIIIALLPVGFIVLILIFNPNYILNVFRITHWLGYAIFSLSAILIMIGLWVMQKISNINV